MKATLLIAATLAAAGAQAQAKAESHSSSTSYSSSRSAWNDAFGGHLSLNRTPLTQAIAAVQQIGARKPVYVSGAAERVLKSRNEPVTLSFYGFDQTQALKALTKDAGLTVSESGDQIHLLKTGESPGTRVEPLRSILLDLQLGRVVPVNLVQVPASMAASMIEGMTGLRITGDAVPDPMGGGFGFGPMKFVTVTDNGRSLRHVLDDLAQQLDANAVVHDGWVEMKRK